LHPAQVGAEFTQNLDFAGCAAYANAAHAALTGTASSTEYNEADLREAVVQNLVHVHESVHKACKRLAKEQQVRRSRDMSNRTKNNLSLRNPIFAHFCV